MTVTTPTPGPAAPSIVHWLVLFVLAALNLAGLAMGLLAGYLIVTLQLKGEPAGFFAFSLMYFGPLQFLLFIPTVILAIVALVRRRLVGWYVAVAGVSLLALVIDVAGFVLALWH